jgi:1-pyrroline-4-hydroxy-2-carboxylate deaminase
MAHIWQNVFPAVTTQFNADLSLNLDATSSHISQLLDSGIDGVIMLGSLGENNTLLPEEKLEVVRAAKSAVGGKVPVLSGVSELSTQMACDYVKKAEAAGADGFMVMPAMVYHSDRRETLAYFRAVANAATKPIILYNNPIAYKVDISAEMLEELASEEKFVAVKESCGDTRRITDIFNQVGDRYCIFGGVDDLIFEAAALGAKGWIAGVGLAFPKENQHLWNLMMAGKWDEALEIYRWYTPILKLDIGNKFVQKIKLLLQEVGMGAEYVRAPRLTLEGAERADALRIISEGLAKRPKL